MTATATITITTAEQLDALPVHKRVADVKGVEWRKHYGPGFKTTGWSFRCLGGYNRDQQSSEFLAQYAPLTVLPDED